MSVDVLAIGAHPDDVDLGVGGTLLRLSSQGFRVAILDLTRGEAASRGAPDERVEEADEAAELLDVEDRYNAELPDGGIQNTKKQQRRVVPFIRAIKPRVILSHRKEDRHPDHCAAHDLVRDANFFAGVASIETDEEPYRAPHVHLYNPYYDDAAAPDFIVDISDFFEQKLRALEAFRSQLYNPEYEGAETRVSGRGFWEAIRTRAAYWGQRIDVEYGEPFYTDGPLSATTLPGLEAKT